MASDAAEELYTLFGIKDEYTEPAKKIVKETEEIGKAADKAQTKISALGAALAKTARTSLGRVSQGLKSGGMGVANAYADNIRGSLTGLGDAVLSALNPIKLITSTVGTLMSTLGSLASSIIGGVVNAFHTLATAALATGAALAAGFIAFTKSAIQEAGKIERITATFNALGAGAKGAADKMKYLQDFAQKSISQFDDLAEAGTLLEASGLRMERFLPVISNIAGAFGGGKEAVMELASALGRTTSGVFGETMEILRRFGIGVAALKSQGIEIDKGGQVKATAAQFLRAVENITRERFGKIGDVMNDTLEVKFSNLGDAWNQMLDNFGKSFFPFIKGLIDQVQPFISFLSKSGIIAQVGKNFADSMQRAFSAVGGGGGGLLRMASFLIAAFERLPSLLEKTFSFLGKVAQKAGEIGVSLYNTIGQGIVSMINMVQNAIAGLQHLMQSMLAGLLRSPGLLKLGAILGIGGAAELSALSDREREIAATAISGIDYRPQQMQFTPISSIGQGFEQMLKGVGLDKERDAIKTRGSEIYAAFMRYQQNGGDKAGPANPESFAMFNQSYVRTAEDTARHTAEIRDEVKKQNSIADRILGGGDRGKKGISAAEFGVFRSGGSASSITIKIDSGGGGKKSIEEIVADGVADAVTQLQRQGMLAGGAY